MKKRKIRLSAILLFLVMIILIPTTLSIYRETKTKTLGINLTHPNYNLTLDADGGTIPTTSGYTNSQDNKTATKVVTYGHEYGTLPTPVKEGYRFDGWNGKNLANVTDISNINRQTILDVIKIAAGTYTYSAVLTNNNELITALRIIDSNNNIISTSNYVLGNDTGIAQGNFTLDENNTIKIAVVSKESGYSVDVSNVQIEKGAKKTTYEPYYVTSSTNVTQAKNHALTAKYTPNTYSVVFDKNDTNATGTMNNQTFTYDTAQTLTPNAYTKTEYTFTGWNTRADGQGTAYLDGVSVNNLTTTNNGTVTLYAQWIANTYTVTLDANGGTIPTTSGWTNSQDNKTATKTLAYDSPYGTLPTPVKEGYRFDGWNGKNLFDLNNFIETYSPYQNNAPQIVDFNGEQVLKIYGATNEEGRSFKYMKDAFKSNTQYIISLDLYDVLKYYEETNEYLNGMMIYINYTDGTNENIFPSNLYRINNPETWHNIVYTSETNKTISYLRLTFNASLAYSYIKNMQIEEGNSYTPYEPYYITSSTNVTQAKNHTLTAKWTKKEATFDTGQNFNAKIKQLAGNTGATYETEDTNITSIQRANSVPSSWIVNDVVTPPSDNNVVSTNDSMYPIYAWYDNGIIYYYTEALNPFMNTDGSYMFIDLKNVTSIDLSTINTSKTSRMQIMFAYCSSLTSLNISNFDTRNVIDMGYMFSHCYSLRSIIFGENFITSNVKRMYEMFNQCRSLESINLNNFNTSNVTEMGYMFCMCQSLISLDLSKIDMTKVTNTTNMLYNMSVLNSLKTPKVYPTDTSVTITLPTTLYDVSENAYTTLTSTSPTETWIYTATTFLVGPTFNAKIKKLANPTLENITYDINVSNITSIVRANSLPNGFIPTEANVVSTSDSRYPIYSWYDNGTIYYYTQALNPYMNRSATAMFRGLTGLTSIDINTINTSKVTNMRDLFQNDSELTSINLSNFDTSNVIDMWAMFAWCSKLESINVSNFVTNELTNAAYMFAGTKIQNLDLSALNLNRVTNTTSMLTGMASLKSLKTPNTYPSDTSVTIGLTKVLYDASGNSYGTLTSTSPTSTWLKLAYTVSFNANGGTGSMTNQKIQYNTATNLKENTFTREGYKFAGWNTSSDGTGAPYLDEASVTSLANANDTITLYAQWVQLMAEDIGYDGNAVNCNNVQCMIDELYNMLN